jgi:hypothetical protein
MAGSISWKSKGIPFVVLASLSKCTVPSQIGRPSTVKDETDTFLKDALAIAGVAGRPARSNELQVSADDTWGLMVTPGGDEVVPMHMY